MGDEIVLNIEGLLSSSSSKSICKICHEGEEESSKSMETPCGCSGTLKFAHRDCIQRWCNEKGDTTCEICLQNFVPGYAATPKKSQAATRRERVEVHRDNQELHQILETDYNEEYNRTSEKIVQIVALMLTTVLFVGHFISVFGSEEENSALINVTIFILRVAGIILPLYIIRRLIVALQYWISRQHRHLEYDSEEDDDYDSSEDEEGYTV